MENAVMLSPAPRATPRSLLLPALVLLFLRSLSAAPTGPTLQFDYGRGQAESNALGQFMYFVPLISPEGVTVHTNAGNTQCARVVSFHGHTNNATFRAVCEFNFLGAGRQRNVFDHTPIIERHRAEMAVGKVLAHQLDSIDVEGAGSGTVEVEGLFTNGLPSVTEIRLKFNSHGRPSPVSVDLRDLALKNGSLDYHNETIARVNALTFRQKSPPKMEVTLASVKRANAGNGRWENFLGELKGAAANLLLPPINITAKGQSAMMEFGAALALEKATFTFPFADHLTNGAAITP
jgi:hypothetical protein